ncbi:hypothetical protein LRQ08_21520 [Rhodococcus qingshengii]|uniref:hypothetical protein n=1 Tax=Rhodococcus qingshengii TaxID=334542 RepID=UPI0021134FAA|nr:hypothetical protein [Rhodococcus qingshengii]UUE23808.1 hypothetical protein LRQ08_21520 [Rhodococcus qingshengii]
MRLRRLPGESALVTHFNGGRPRWDDETYLLADLIHVMSGKPHPARPKPVKMKPTDTSRREQIKRQYRQRKRIPAGRKTP